jgi:hypothetical protein
MGTNGKPAQCGGGNLGQHRRICAFFNAASDTNRVSR